MACESCHESSAENASPTTATGSVREVFEAFWPKQFLYPPIAPYLAATVTRPQAYAWMKSLAPVHQEVLTGDTMAVLDFIGMAMMGGGDYRRVRKKSKPKPDPGPYLPPYDPTDGPRSSCWREAYRACGSYGNIMWITHDPCDWDCIDGRWGPDSGGGDSDDDPAEPEPY